MTVVARVMATNMRPMNNRRGFILNVTISDGEHDLDLTFFAKHQRPLAFHESQLAVGAMATFSGTISSYRGRLQLAHPEYEVLMMPMRSILPACSADTGLSFGSESAIVAHPASR